MPGAVSMRTLYFRRGLVCARPLGCAVLHVTPLLRELVLEAVRIGELRVRQLQERALRDLIILHLENASPVPTLVALPRDERGLALAQAVLSAPEQTRPLAVLCREHGVSVRTIQRIFRKDIGTDFETWRRQVRLTKAVDLLISGRSVKHVAFSIGYRQSSAFVETFRRAFGRTPKAWTLWLERLNLHD